MVKAREAEAVLEEVSVNWGRGGRSGLGRSGREMEAGWWWRWGAGGICDGEEMGTLWAKVESEGRS